MRHDTFQLLAALAPGEADAAEILARLERTGGGAPTVPTLYRRLKEALDAGWVVVAGPGDAEGPGRPGQRYRITARGRASARAEAVRWRTLTDAVLDDGSAS